MCQDNEGLICSEAGEKIHIVQPLRDLESNWAIDLAKNLEEYLLKIYSGEITGKDDAHLSVNFAEAALLLQGSVQVYSRKVEYLHSLVLQALEFISQKGRPEQLENDSGKPEEGGVPGTPDGDDDLFWGLDDIPVDLKNTLDGATTRDAPLDYFVKPPADLVVLEGDCLDTIGDGGELDSYLLATNDLYQDFILLDSCDAAAVDDFLKRDDETNKEQIDVSRDSSLPSKSCKSFQSLTRQSGGSSRRLSVGKSQDANLNQSPRVDHGFEFNGCDNKFHSPACKIPGNNNNELETDDWFPGFGDLDVTDDDDDDDDPWKPLNPHEPGNLKVKPFRKVIAYRRDGINSIKRVPTTITTEFPLAQLYGTISPDLTQIWEAQQRVTGRRHESQSPPLYEKLRQSLVLRGVKNFDACFNSKDDNEDNGYDSGDPEFGPPDFDMPMPESIFMNEDVPISPKTHDDGTPHFHIDETYGHDNSTPEASLEDLCLSHLDSLLASIGETEKQTELAAKISSWKQRIEQSLEEQDARPAFDIHDYGERVLDKLSLATNSENAISFVDVVRGQEKHDVARTFSALLQLVNNGNVDMHKVDTTDDEHTCYTAVNPFYVRLLRHAKRRQEVHLQSSKKRVKSPMKKGETKDERDKSGKENRQPVSSAVLGSTSSSMSLKMNDKFSLNLGKVEGVRGTPESKRKRRSRFVERADLINK